MVSSQNADENRSLFVYKFVSKFLNPHSLSDLVECQALFNDPLLSTLLGIMTETKKEQSLSEENFLKLQELKGLEQGDLIRFFIGHWIRRTSLEFSRQHSNFQPNQISLASFLKQETETPKSGFPGRRLDEVFQFNPDFLLFPTFNTLQACKRKFDSRQVEAIEDDLLDMWKSAALEQT